MNKKLLTVFTLILVYSSIYSCKTWEYNVIKQGIHFERINQTKSGITTGYMSDSNIIQGFPCAKGWIHFKKEWQLLSFQLSKNFILNRTLLPAETWLHFPNNGSQKGYVCSFPDDYEVQGYFCRGTGGYKGTHTGFYTNGKLRSFFPPDDVIVQGVYCKSSSFVNIELYENGNIKSCQLAKDLGREGKVYKAGSSIEFDESGKVK